MSPKQGGSLGPTVAFEGLTPKQTQKVFQRVHNLQTEQKMRANQLLNTQPETTNCSYNQYGIVDAGTSTSLGPLAEAQNPVGYMTSLGHNSPHIASPLVSGNQSQINFRHTRVQSNNVDSFQERVTSQSALGLSNLGSSQPKTRVSLPISSKVATRKGPTQSQQIQEKIRQLHLQSSASGGAKNSEDRNVMTVIGEINRRIELQNLSMFN